MVRELGATPIRCTYSYFQDLSPESILEEIWYGSRELHLFAFSKRLEGTRLVLE
jgi:hypothetical protein